MKKLMLLIQILIVLCFASSSLAALEPPVLSSSTDGLNLSVSWTEVPGATGYTLHYAQYPYSPGAPIDSLDRGGATSFSIDLWVGAAYYIAVTAYDDQEHSNYSNVETVTIEVIQVPPVAPELSATTSGLNLSLSWETVPDATGYILSYAPTSLYSGPASFITKDVGGNTNFQAVLWDGAAFTVAVQAYDDQGVSEYSNMESFVIEQPSKVGLSGNFYGRYRLTNVKYSNSNLSPECPGDGDEFYVTDIWSGNDLGGEVWVPRNTVSNTFRIDNDSATETMTISYNRVEFNDIGDDGDWRVDGTIDFENMTYHEVARDSDPGYCNGVTDATLIKVD